MDTGKLGLLLAFALASVLHPGASHAQSSLRVYSDDFGGPNQSAPAGAVRDTSISMGVPRLHAVVARLRRVENILDSHPIPPHGHGGHTHPPPPPRPPPPPPPPAVCPPGQVGTPPNCTTPPPAVCPPGQVGTPPNCTTPPPAVCPPGQVGTPPNCTTPPPAVCPSGQVGTPPNCITPSALLTPMPWTMAPADGPALHLTPMYVPRCLTPIRTDVLSNASTQMTDDPDYVEQ